MSSSPHKPPPKPEPGVASRHVAWRILLEQDARGAFLKELFDSRLRGFSPEDGDLIRTICLGVVRWRRLLDYNLAQQAERGIKDARLRMLLRVGAFQLFFLDGVPAFAVVHTAVEIAKREFGKSEAGFTNAVLKALARIGLRRQPGNDIEAMAVNASHPTWLVKRWSRALSSESLTAALHRNNEEAPLWLRANPRKALPDRLAESLAIEGVELRAWEAFPQFFRIVRGADKALRSQSFSDGAFSIQDPIAYWIAVLLDWHPGQTVFDACSAPGGKSALLLELAAARGEDIQRVRLFCGDVSFARLRKIRDARERLGHSELLPVVSDLQASPFRVLFDRILVDAPCSNLGVLRRRPEARWSLTAEKVAGMADRQSALLEQAVTQLARGGRLVYATCSAEEEETMAVVQKTLARHPEFRLDPAETKVPTALCKQGCLWVYPGEAECDGFFAAALVRK